MHNHQSLKGTHRLWEKSVDFVPAVNLEAATGGLNGMKLEPLNKRGEQAGSKTAILRFIHPLPPPAKQATAAKAESNQQLTKPSRVLFDKVSRAAVTAASVLARTLWLTSMHAMPLLDYG